MESIWIQEDPRVPVDGHWEPTRILPTSKIDLILFYADAFEEIGNPQPRSVPTLNLTGQRTHSVQVRATGRTGVLIVSFYPWGAAPFFDISLEEVNNQSVDLGVLIGEGRAGRALCQAMEAKDTLSRVAVIEEFLLGRLMERRLDPLVVEAVRRMSRHFEPLSVETLAKGLRVSRRHLTRRFRLATGLAPKTLAQVLRFQKAIGQLKLGGGWNDVAFRCGYSDQSHFIREIARFSQLLPSQIVKRNQETDLMRYFNRSADLSHFYNTTYL